MNVRDGKYAFKADDLLCFCQDLPQDTLENGLI